MMYWRSSLNDVLKSNNMYSLVIFLIIEYFGELRILGNCEAKVFVRSFGTWDEKGFFWYQVDVWHVVECLCCGCH